MSRTIELEDGMTADLDMDYIILSDNPHTGIVVTPYQLLKILQEHAKYFGPMQVPIDVDLSLGIKSV